MTTSATFTNVALVIGDETVFQSGSVEVVQDGSGTQVVDLGSGARYPVQPDPQMARRFLLLDGTDRQLVIRKNCNCGS